MQATKSTNDTDEIDGVSSISHCEIIPVQDLQPQKSKLGLDLNVFKKEGARVYYKKNGTKFSCPTTREPTRPKQLKRVTRPKLILLRNNLL